MEQHVEENVEDSTKNFESNEADRTDENVMGTSTLDSLLVLSNMRPVRDKTTQTTTRSCKCDDKKMQKIVKSKATQNFLTKDNFPERLFIHVCRVSTSTQTEIEDASPLLSKDQLPLPLPLPVPPFEVRDDPIDEISDRGMTQVLTTNSN